MPIGSKNSSERITREIWIARSSKSFEPPYFWAPRKNLSSRKSKSRRFRPNGLTTHCEAKLDQPHPVARLRVSRHPFAAWRSRRIRLPGLHA